MSNLYTPRMEDWKLNRWIDFVLTGVAREDFHDRLETVPAKYRDQVDQSVKSARKIEPAHGNYNTFDI